MNEKTQGIPATIFISFPKFTPTITSQNSSNKFIHSFHSSNNNFPNFSKSVSFLLCLLASHSHFFFFSN